MIHSLSSEVSAPQPSTINRKIGPNANLAKRKEIQEQWHLEFF